MTEASHDEGIAFADEWNRGNPARRCTATSRRTKKRCARWAIRGGTVCTTHGGSTRHIKRKARERIERAADRLALELLGIATAAESEAVRLAAVKDALDRAGLKPTETVEVEVKPYQQLLQGIARTRRDGSPVPQPQPRALEPVLDAEVVEPEPAETRAERPAAPTRRYPPGAALMTLEQAICER